MTRAGSAVLTSSVSGVQRRDLLLDRYHLRSTQRVLKPVPIVWSCRGAAPPVDEVRRSRVFIGPISQHVTCRAAAPLGDGNRGWQGLGALFSYHAPGR